MGSSPLSAIIVSTFNRAGVLCDDRTIAGLAIPLIQRLPKVRRLRMSHAVIKDQIYLFV
jgi:hypothetical protein